MNDSKTILLVNAVPLINVTMSVNCSSVVRLIAKSCSNDMVTIAIIAVRIVIIIEAN